MPIFERNRPLLDAYRRGEKDALAQVYRGYFDDVLSLVRNGFFAGEQKKSRVPGTSDHQAQLDAVQEVFVKAFADRARLAFDGVRPYRPYLLRIAKNARIDALRRAGREVLVEDAGQQLDASSRAEGPSGPWGSQQSAAEQPDAEEDLHWQRLRRATQAFIAAQDAELQRFVELRFAEEKSQYEVLEAMQISRRRVRTLERRAQQGLKRYLAEARLG